jgi:hypothetical protein
VPLHAGTPGTCLFSRRRSDFIAMEWLAFAVFASQVYFGPHLDTRMREKDYSDLQRSGYICCS